MLALLPAATRTQLAGASFAQLLNSPQGTRLLKQVVNAVLLFYRNNPLGASHPLRSSVAVVYEVCDKLAGFCAGYFFLGEKLFNQGFLGLQRLAEDAYHVDERELRVRLPWAADA